MPHPTALESLKYMENLTQMIQFLTCIMNLIQRRKEHVDLENPGKNGPDPGDFEGNHREMMGTLNGEVHSGKTIDEPDPDDSLAIETIKDQPRLNKAYKEPDPDKSETNQVVQAEPDLDDDLAASHEVSRMQIDEPDPDDQELQRIQDPLTAVCSHLQKAIEILRAELKATEATTALQTLFKILSEDVGYDETGKRKDPSMLWLSKSSLEACMA
ncbi:hypothetical protein NC652_007319 [Populus alba x Populus x berolinensis]|nr:hypothetical protein NC652_007319 [Populus alba x Populus x berolinensis]